MFVGLVTPEIGGVSQSFGPTCKMKDVILKKSSESLSERSCESLSGPPLGWDGTASNLG